MDKLASIRAFTKVVQHNGFAAAARDLRLSRSAVSKHVIELEEELGVQLLSRTTRGVTPTENGQAYYERCLRFWPTWRKPISRRRDRKPRCVDCCGSTLRCRLARCISRRP
jgi:DNA-binding transcriptional LysR family regulator